MDEKKLSMRQVSSTQVEIWLKANNIIPEKTELFYCFVFSIFKLIDATYMGDDVTELESDKQNHFNWCWTSIIMNFQKEKIFFEQSGEHYEYFWSFFREAFYYEEQKNDLTKVDNFFQSIFNLKTKKTKSELDMLGDLYRILDNSLNKLS